MPFTALRLTVTSRFREIDLFLSAISAQESSDPLVPDTFEVRKRGLFFVHLYAAFEFSMTQAFTRLADHVSSTSVKHLHLTRPIASLVLDDMFKSLADMRKQRARHARALETLELLDSHAVATVRDNVLSDGFTSADADMITLAFAAHGVEADPFYDVSVKGYLGEVVERRHAVAHGRESAATVGNRRTSELRRRYDVLYAESLYVLDRLQDHCVNKRYIANRYRRFY